MNSGQFKPGGTPWNKGIPFDSGGRSHQTRFKPGQKPANWRPIGSLRITKEGHLEIKTDTSKKGWARVARETWKKHHGDYPPPNMAVILLNGKNLDLASNQDINNLTLISRQQLMQRNSVHNLPKPIKDVIAIKRRVTRIINEKS